MDLEKKAYALRRQTLQMVYRAKSGHIGGDFSIMEILTLLYNEVMRVAPDRMEDPDRDRFVLSKGHTADALYAVLADRGFFDSKELESFSQCGTRLIGHPNNKVPGIEMDSGSLGHGLAVSVGMAIAGKMDHRDYRVYTVMGDGELAEGSVWEAAMCAAQYKLDNLCAVVDRNRLQISGTTDQVMSTAGLGDRWSSFGWSVIEVEDGNSIPQLRAAFAKAAQTKGKPTLLIADTVKGKGVSFMENQVGWHHRIPTEQEYEQAMAELSERGLEENG
ncbi:MAG TPA: transketolase [Candidatus Pygmaiobacter gallistercoris]|nr:transketolase [Candidatus Pygmaiobacter gallistercoris]